MRLIDADALIRKECGRCDGYCNMFDGETCLKCNSHNKCELRDAIDESPTIDAEPVKHGRWIETSKHEWQKNDDGSVDEFAFDYGFHNGPRCKICGFAFCEHCDPDFWEDNGCKKRYVCSECGRTETTKEPYCNCGAKMDAKES